MVLQKVGTLKKETPMRVTSLSQEAPAVLRQVSHTEKVLFPKA